MTDAKPKRGRPRYTAEERKTATDRSFMASLENVNDKGCVLSRQDHFTDYDGKRIRTRTFAWKFWNQDSPLDGSKIVMLCTTPGCIANNHMMSVELIRTVEATRNIDNMNDDDRKFEWWLVDAIEKAEEAGEDYSVKKDELQKFWAKRLITEQTDDADIRVNFILSFITEDEAEYRRIAPEWGLIIK